MPGEGLAEAGAGRGRGVYEQLIGALQLPPECAAKGRALGGLFASGERHLLPSFFNLLRHMHAQARARLRRAARMPGGARSRAWLVCQAGRRRQGVSSRTRLRC